MSNLSNCSLCKHKQNPDGGWCYMFRVEPQQPCAQHSIPVLSARASRIRAVNAMLQKGKV